MSIGEPARGLLNDDYNTLSSVLDSDLLLVGISEKCRTLFHKDVILDNQTNRQVITPRTSLSFEDYRESMRQGRRSVSMV